MSGTLVSLHAPSTPTSLSTDLALATSKRVSVLTQGCVVPLLPGRPIRDSTQSPWTGVYLEEHNLGAIFIPEHEHATFVLHVQLNERVHMDWHSSGRTGRQITGAGNLIFLTPGTRDHLLFHGPSRRIVVSVDPALIRQRADDLELKCMPEFDNRWAFQDEQLRLLISEMEREMSTGWAMGSLYGDSLSTAFAIALLKKCGKAVQDSPQLKGGLSPGRLRRVLSYIHENFQRDIRLGELANIAGLSDYHFARSFRQTTGATPHQYLSHIRINRAKSLLLRRHWTVLQVAGAVGFADASRLSKVFRANTGVSPGEWRREA
jgi:AraC family transcriptional regulator